MNTQLRIVRRGGRWLICVLDSHGEGLPLEYHAGSWRKYIYWSVMS